MFDKIKLDALWYLQVQGYTIELHTIWWPHPLISRPSSHAPRYTTESPLYFDDYKRGREWTRSNTSCLRHPIFPRNLHPQRPINLPNISLRIPTP